MENNPKTMELNPIQQAKAKQLKEFRKRTKAELADLSEKLLAPDSTIYEVDFGEPIGLMHFRRMSLQDWDSIADYAEELNSTSGQEHRAVTRKVVIQSCNLLAKYCLDGISKTQWLKMARETNRQQDFNKIFLHLMAITAYPNDIIEFFRVIGEGQQFRGGLRVSSPNASATFTASIQPNPVYRGMVSGADTQSGESSKEGD